MKYSALRAFEKHLEEAAPNHFSSLYALLGKDPFQRKIALERLLRFLQGEKAVLDGEGLEIRSLVNQLHSNSLFSRKTVVVLHNSDKLPKPSMEWLEAYFAKTTPDIFLVLTASTLHHGTHFFKKIEKYGVILEFAEEKPWEKEKSSVDWVQAHLSALNKTIDAQTAQALVKQVGTDGETLFQEMEKLVCYVGERRAITVQDVRTICIGVNNENVWQLGEALFRLDAAAALRIGHALLDEGTALLSLLRQIRTQFQTDLQVSTILAKGGSPADVTALFGYMKGKILEQHCHAARHYGWDRFKSGLLKIDEAELQAKSSYPERQLLEVLIVRLTK